MKRALYFGCGSTLGHYLFGAESYRTLHPVRDFLGFPWDIGALDGGLLKNRKVPDEPDGRVHWTCGGAPLWIAFFWWDRSGDKRPASNSGFYVQGFEHTETQAALDYAMKQWSNVTARQLFPLVLVP